MKQTILLFACLLCLGCTLPLAGFWLGAGSLQTNATIALASAWGNATQGAADGTSTSDATNTANSADTGTDTQSSAGQALADLWGSTGDTAQSSNTESITTQDNTTSETQNTASDGASQAVDEFDSAADLAPLLLYNEANGQVLTVSVAEYLIGAVASELPMTWPDAALQAQAIACHSYILYCKEHADTTAMDGAYLAVDPARRQGYMTDEILQSYWGDDYEANYARLAALVAQVLDVVVLFDGAPAATSYFAISNGTTESSAIVWGEALPYLTSVSSTADANAEGYTETVTYTTAQVENILYTAFGIAPNGLDPTQYFGAFTLTDAGYIASIEVCGTSIAGTTFRTAFALRSSCFWVVYSDDAESFSFTTLGYGHGVGLSQWGAYFMAEGGSSYADILAHYYPYTTLGVTEA